MNILIYLKKKSYFRYSVLAFIRHQLSMDPQLPHVQYKPFTSSVGMFRWRDCLVILSETFMLRIFCVSNRIVKVDSPPLLKSCPVIINDVEYVCLLCSGWICSSRTKPAGNPSLRSFCLQAKEG